MEMHIHISIICTHKRRKEGGKGKGKGGEEKAGQGREGKGREGMEDESGEELGVVVHTCKIGVREAETRWIPGAHLSPRLA